MRPIPPIRTVRRALRGACGVVLIAVLAGCSERPDPVTSARTLVIGVGDDRPGIATVDGGGNAAGFDIDVARYVARGLGWSALDVEFRPLPDSDRELALKSGEVDVVIGAYRITEERDRLVDFAGPYLVARQDLLVAFDEALITGPHSLDRRILCSVDGSSDAAVLREPRFSPAVVLRGAATLGDCVDDLLAGDVDAVTADDVVLTGYVAQHPRDLKVLGAPFVEHRYGIGLPEGSPDVGVVNELLTELIESGSWRENYLEHLSAPGETVPDPPVPGSSLGAATQ